MKNVIILLLFIFFSYYYSFCQYWEKVAGLNPYVNKIFSPINEPNRIIVASNGFATDILQKNIEFPFLGNGYAESLDSGRTFTSFFLNQRSVYDIYQSKTNPNLWFAAIRNFNRGGIVRSTDNGNSWGEDIACESSNQIYRITSTINEGKEFYVAAAINTSEGFIYSDNDFLTCNSSSLSVETRSIAFSKIHPNLLFITGDPSSQGRVLRSYDNGHTWYRESSGLQGLRVLSILPSSANPSIVLCGVDSLTLDGSSIGKGIYISLDTGKTWQYLTGGGYQIFEFAEHPRYPHLVAAAAGMGGVLVSSIYGHYFEAFNSGLPQGKSVRTVMIPDWDTTEAGFVIFAGVHGDGLYKSTYLKTSVENYNSLDFSSISVSPQPANEKVNIQFNIPFSTSCDISIYNAYGIEVYSLKNLPINNGENLFTWNSSSFAAGLYFVQIRSGSSSVIKKFIINR